MLDRKLLAIVGAVAALAGALGGWTINGWRLNAAYDAERLQAARDAARDLQAAYDARDALAADLAASNDLHLAKLKGAQDETNRLRDCLRSGTCGLRVAVKCPDQPTAGATGTGVDSGAWADLAPTAGQAYFALRDGIDRVDVKLAACQAELKKRVPRKEQPDSHADP